MSKSVVITGIGLICSASDNIEEFTRNVINGVKAFSKIKNSELENYHEKYAALIEVYPKIDNIKPGEKYDDVDLLALYAARNALNDANLEIQTENIPLIFATCSGPMRSIENYYKNGKGVDKITRYYGHTAALVRETLSLAPFFTTVTTACSSSLASAGFAADMIKQGKFKIILTGGADTFSTTTFAGFSGLKAMSYEPTIPFSDQIGMTLGEGSAFLVLEEKEHAIARNAKIYGEITGFGTSNDAFHSSAPDRTGRGQALAMKRAISNAGISPDEVEYINFHGTGTAANDKAETKAVRNVFLEHSEKLAVSSTKSIFGHTLGAAGALELAATLLSAKAGHYPPTAGLKTKRDGCSLDCIPETKRAWKNPKIIMSNNFAFGGNNASMLVSVSNNKELKQPNLAKKRIFLTAGEVITRAGIGIDKVIEEKTLVSTKNNFVESFNPRKISRGLDLSKMDRSGQFATSAVQLTLNEARYSNRPKDKENLGLFLALSTGSTTAEREHITEFYANNNTISKIQNFPYIVPNSIEGSICRSLEIKGENSVISSGIASAAAAIEFAANTIRAERAESVIVAACDELIKDTSQIVPEGQILSEGSAAIMLESESNTKKRNITPILEYLGLESFDAESGKLKENIENFLEKFDVKTENITTFSFHGTNLKYKNEIATLLNNAKFIDYSSITGFLPAVAPLVPLTIFSKDNTKLELSADRNYFMSFTETEFNTFVLLLFKGI